MYLKRSRRAFTIVEMLTVVALIAVLLVVVVGALGGGGREGNLPTAVRMMSSMIKSASDVAVMKGSSSRLMIFSDTSVTNDIDVQRLFRYLVVVYDEDQDENTDGPWVPVNEGSYLPDGIFLSPNSVATTIELVGSAINYEESDPLPQDSLDLVGVTGGTSRQWLFLEFTPDGRAEPGSAGNKTLVLYAGGYIPNSSGDLQVQFVNEFAFEKLFVSMNGNPIIVP